MSFLENFEKQIKTNKHRPWSHHIYFPGLLDEKLYLHFRIEYLRDKFGLQANDDKIDEQKQDDRLSDGLRFVSNFGGFF